MIYSNIFDIDKKYHIIYADPPWTYDNMLDNNPNLGGIQYPTMSIQELCDMPIKDITEKDCALFIWVTMPKLEQCFSVINAWGFKYITCAFVWVKTTKTNRDIYSGLGHWVNGNAEICLFCKKGTPKRVNKNVKQIILAPLTIHSQKPYETRDRIVQLMGDVSRIELFARNETDGWDCFGNEIDVQNNLF